MDPKLFLLRSLVTIDEKPFVYDKDLEIQVRPILVELNKDISLERKIEIGGLMAGYFEEYDLAILRVLFSNLHLVHYTENLCQIFERLFESISTKVNNGQSDLDLLLREISYYSDTFPSAIIADSDAFSSATVALVLDLIGKLKLPEEKVRSIFANDSFDDHIKYLIFDRCAFSRMHTNILFDYFLSFSDSKAYLPSHIDLLIEAYCKTGKAGFEKAIGYYHHVSVNDNEVPYTGSKLLSGMGEWLSEWFIEWNGSPIEKFIEPIINAIPNSSYHRDAIIRKLVDKWAADKGAGNIILNRLRFVNITNEEYFNQFEQRQTKSHVFECIHLNREGIRMKEQIRNLKLLVNSKNRYANAIEKIIAEGDTKLFYYCILNPDQNFSVNVFQFIHNWCLKTYSVRAGQNYTDLAFLVGKVHQPRNFEKLPQNIRNALFSSEPYVNFIVEPITNRQGIVEFRFDKLKHLVSPELRTVVAIKVNRLN